MPGPKPAYPIQLLDKEVVQLRQIISARKSAQGQVLRARIVLTAHEQPGWSNQQLAAEVGTSDRMVRKWRRRWCETKCLADLPRSGAPKRFSP